MEGPMAAVRSSGRVPYTSFIFSATHLPIRATVPRQPECASATARFLVSTKYSGTQSA